MWGRGLKLNKSQRLGTVTRVASHVGAWIETPCLLCVLS